jgi:hypothetical protein
MVSTTGEEQCATHTFSSFLPFDHTNLKTSLHTVGGSVAPWCGGLDNGTTFLGLSVPGLAALTARGDAGLVAHALQGAPVHAPMDDKSLYCDVQTNRPSIKH